MNMQLEWIRRLNLVTSALLVLGIVALFGSFALGLVFGPRTPLLVIHGIGWVLLIACLLLTFAVDRVRCPKCGKPFNRPEYGNWLVRNFAKTRPRRSCAPCGHGARDA